MKKRTAETLIEVVTAMTVFGIVAAGIFDFMAGQTLAIARTKAQDTMLYSAQKWISETKYPYPADSEDKVLGVSRKWNDKTKTLTLSKNGSTLTLKLD